YRRSIELAPKLWPETNENIEMFRAAYALFLNTRHRFAEAVPLFTTVIARADRNPEFLKQEVYVAAQLGRSIAAYALQPTADHLAAYKTFAPLPADASWEIKEVARQQAAVAKFLGIDVPAAAAEPSN